MKMPFKTIDILGVPVSPVTRAELLEYVIKSTNNENSNRSTIIQYANIHTINEAQKSLDLMRTFQECDLVYCDGAGVKLGAKLLGQTIPERITGADWIYDLAAIVEKKNITLFFLAGNEGVADSAVRTLKAKLPNLKIAGTHHGYITSSNEIEVIKQINNSKADILLVGMGTPMQELWINKVSSDISVPVIWSVGAVFDFVSGNVSRAPRWMCDNGLEWLYRLLIEPKRMWKRYIVGNVLFTIKVLKNSF